MKIPLSSLNQMSQAEFVAVLGPTFEQTPVVAAAVWTQRPFETVSQLHQVMMQEVGSFSSAQQLALIRAHPGLGSRAKMAAASISEQRGAGLDQLSPADYTQLQQLNQDYESRFGFPFVLAVKGHTVESILAALRIRLQNPPTQEQQQALDQIAQIAYFRLQQWIRED